MYYEMNKSQYEILSKEIVDSSYQVHKEMGPGLLESVYQSCMIYELESRGIKVDSEVVMPLYYKGNILANKYRIDLLVENNIILELKSVEVLKPVHRAQIISYLKMSGCHLGFLINFNESVIKNGIIRVVNNY